LNGSHRRDTGDKPTPLQGAARRLIAATMRLPLEATPVIDDFDYI
jgi:hypothetical protein